MAAKRETISPRGDRRFIRRDENGRIRESEDAGRSLAQDRRKQAKNTTTSGQGDKGDRRASASKSTARKSAAKSTGRKSATKKTASKENAMKKSASKKSASRQSASKKSASSRPASKQSTTRKAAPRRTAARSTVPNAIQLLVADHQLVRKLLAELEQTTSRGVQTRGELLARIRREIEVHTAIEEEIFYPALRAAGKNEDDEKMYFEAKEEHRAAGDLVLPDLLATDPASECFGGRAKVLKELIEHHADEEEKEMFPRARQLLPATALRELGERMRERKESLLAQPAAPKSAVGRLLATVVDAVTPSHDGRADSEDDSADAAPRTQRGTGNGSGSRASRHH